MWIFSIVYGKKRLKLPIIIQSKERTFITRRDQGHLEVKRILWSQLMKNKLITMYNILESKESEGKIVEVLCHKTSGYL